MWQKKLSVHPRPDGHHTIPKFTYQFSPQASLSHVPDDHGRRITWRKRSKKSCDSRRRFGRCNPPHLGRVVFPHVSFQNASFGLTAEYPATLKSLLEKGWLRGTRYAVTNFAVLWSGYAVRGTQWLNLFQVVSSFLHSFSYISFFKFPFIIQLRDLE